MIKTIIKLLKIIGVAILLLIGSIVIAFVTCIANKVFPVATTVFTILTILFMACLIVNSYS